MPDYRVVPGPAHIHPFANAVASDDLIFVSGLASPGEGVTEQVRGVFAQIEEILEGVGSSLSEIVYVRPTVTKRAYVDELNEALREVLPTPAPATGALLIAELVHEALLVEFEVIAQRGARLLPPTA